jgi:predicted RND superfamily exporter protein
MINGFGLHKLGLVSLRYPLIATLVMIMISLAAAIGISRLEFSGENIEILRDNSQELSDYDELLGQFRNFNNDAVILMRVENLATIEGIETFRDLNFEFQLDERVESILSIFSLVKYGGPDEGWQSALPAEYNSDAEVLASLKQLAKDIPSSQSLFSPNFDSAVMVVYTKAEATKDKNVQETMDALTELGKEFNSETVSVTIAGQPAIRADLIHSIVSDLMLLAPMAFLFCAVLAFVLFRQPMAMALCALPSLLSIGWFLGGAGLTGTSLNFLTNILPALIIVIVFADTLHLYLKWQKLSEKEDDFLVSLNQAIREVGPACALSSVTTAAALLSLCLSGNNGLYELGIVGALAVLGGFVCVVVALPLGAYWASKAGFKPRRSVASKVGVIAGPAMKLLNYRKAVLVCGLLLCAAGLYAHTVIDSRFRLIDYLGTQSEVSQSETFIDSTYYGSTPLFAIVDMNQELALDDPKNEARVYDTIEAVKDVFPAGSFYSLADFADEIKKAGGQINEELIDELPRFLTSRFISEDKSQVLVTIFSSANLSESEMQERLSKMNLALEKRKLEEFVKITGYPVLSGVVAPRLMDNLRISLLVAVLLSIILIAISTRSIKLGLACFVPNMLPIVCVELILYLLGIPLNMSIAVALTVAFGIAVDDSIHMLNQYMLNRRDHDNLPAVAGALKEVTPALFSTTLILSGGLIIMCFSTLPAMAVFALVVIMTLVFAFLADIFQLPAYLALLNKQEVSK